MASKLTAKQLRKLAGALTKSPKQAPALRKPSKKSRKGRQRRKRNGQASSGRASSRMQNMGFVMSPEAMRCRAMNRPYFFTSKNGLPAIWHREYVTDISGSASFTNTQFVVNPGYTATFPWLGTIAANWESYRWGSLKWDYQPTSGNATGSNTALGTLMMGSQYDLSDPAFSSKSQFLNFDGSIDCVPSVSLCHDSLAGYEAPEKLFFVRNTSVASGYDIRLYDECVFNIATAGQQGTNIVGELFVEYVIELVKPKLSTDTAYLQAHGGGTGNTASAAAPIPSSFAITSLSTLALTRLSGTTFSIGTVGTYICQAVWAGGNSIAAVPTVAATTNCSLQSVYGVGTGSNFGFFLAAGTSSSIVFAISVTALTNVITFGGNTSMSGCTFDLFVNQVPAGYTALKSSAEDKLLDRILRLERLLSAQADEDDDYSESGSVVQSVRLKSGGGRERFSRF